MNQIAEKPRFTCHTANLLKEIVNANDGMAILSKPIQIFANLLYDVAERASQINDPILNDLMCALTLYSISDRELPEYDFKAITEIKRIAAAYIK